MTQCAVFRFSFSIQVAYPYTYCMRHSQSHGCRSAKLSKHGPKSYEIKACRIDQSKTRVVHKAWRKQCVHKCNLGNPIHSDLLLLCCMKSWNTPQANNFIRIKTSALSEIRKVTIYLLIDTNSLPTADHFWILLPSMSILSRINSMLMS